MTTETNAERSAINFLRQNVVREKGYTKAFVDAIEEVTLRAERALELENMCNTSLYIQRMLRKENASLQEALKDIREYSDSPLAIERMVDEALAGETNGQRKA